MADENEKRERFRRVAVGRTNKIIDQIRLLGNCANRSNYEYSEEDVQKIFNAIESELRDVRAKYQAKKKNNKFPL